MWKAIWVTAFKQAVMQLPAVVDPKHVWMSPAQNLGDPVCICEIDADRLRKVINYKRNMYASRKSDKGILPKKP